MCESVTSSVIRCPAVPRLPIGGQECRAGDGRGSRLIAMALALLWSVTGCSAVRPVGSIPVIEHTAGRQIAEDLAAVPLIDTSLHSVPLEEVYFDTFRPVNRVVRLSDASTELILSLRDAIPPIYDPTFESARVADAWLANGDIVVGYADRGEAYAYPVSILN